MACRRGSVSSQLSHAWPVRQNARNTGWAIRTRRCACRYPECVQRQAGGCLNGAASAARRVGAGPGHRRHPSSTRPPCPSCTSAQTHSCPPARHRLAHTLHATGSHCAKLCTAAHQPRCCKAALLAQQHRRQTSDCTPVVYKGGSVSGAAGAHLGAVAHERQRVLVLCSRTTRI